MLTVSETRMRKHDTVDIASNMKAIADFVGRGYIKNFHVIQDGKQGIIRIDLNTVRQTQVIAACAEFAGSAHLHQLRGLPKVLKGGDCNSFHIKGVMTDKAARKENVGGEVPTYVWWRDGNMSRIGKSLSRAQGCKVAIQGQYCHR